MSGTLEFGEDRCSHIHPSSAWSFLLFSVLSSVDVRKRIGKEKSFTTKLDWTIISGRDCTNTVVPLIYVCECIPVCVCVCVGFHMKYWCNKRNAAVEKIWAGISVQNLSWNMDILQGYKS